MVFTSFWILYAVDRELVFPKRMDAIVPGWANHLWVRCVYGLCL